MIEHIGWHLLVRPVKYASHLGGYSCREALSEVAHQSLPCDFHIVDFEAFLRGISLALFVFTHSASIVDLLVLGLGRLGELPWRADLGLILRMEYLVVAQLGVQRVVHVFARAMNEFIRI